MRNKLMNFRKQDILQNVKFKVGKSFPNLFFVGHSCFFIL
jgi:hypothetical protein